MIREAATVAKGMLMRDEQASGDKGLYCTADHDDLFASALAKRGKVIDTRSCTALQRKPLLLVQIYSSVARR